MNIIWWSNVTHILKTITFLSTVVLQRFPGLHVLFSSLLIWFKSLNKCRVLLLILFSVKLTLRLGQKWSFPLVVNHTPIPKSVKIDSLLFFCRSALSYTFCMLCHMWKCLGEQNRLVNSLICKLSVLLPYPFFTPSALYNKMLIAGAVDKASRLAR